MKPLLSYKTQIGTFYIAKSEDNLFHPTFNDVDLGAYVNMWLAVEDIASNSTLPVHHPDTNEVIDTSKLGLPEDYVGWERIRG